MQVLASSGAFPLKSVVGKYDLGVFVEPDDLEEIVRGASKFVPNSATVEMSGEGSRFSKHVPCSATEQPATRCQLSATPAWDRYERENSWMKMREEWLGRF